MTTEASDAMIVAQALNDASNSRDLERLVGLFAEDGVIRHVRPPVPPSSDVWTGKQAIREWFEPHLQNLCVEPQNMHVNGELVTWTATISGDMFRQMGIDAIDVTAEAIVKDGKITSLVVTQTPETIRKWQTVMERGDHQAETLV